MPNLICRFSILVALVTLAGLCSAAAQEPMQFSYSRADQSIFARGRIDPGTVSRFQQFLDAHSIDEGATVYLNSPGGSLVEGIQLGKVIRQRKLDTSIAAEGANSAACASACAIAFLGGVSRSVPAGSKYGVHRFRYMNDPMSARAASAQVEQAQIASAILLQYFREMGVDPELYTASALTSSSSVSFLTPELLKKWHVVTEATRTIVAWSIDEAGGITYLRGQRKQGNHSETLALGCKDGALFLFAYYDGRKIGRELSQEMLLLDSERIQLGHLRASQRWDDGSLVVTYRLNSDMWARLRSANKISIVARSNPAGLTGITEIPLAKGLPERDQFARRCMMAREQ